MAMVISISRFLSLIFLPAAAKPQQLVSCASFECLLFNIISQFDSNTGYPELFFFSGAAQFCQRMGLVPGHFQDHFPPLSGESSPQHLFSVPLTAALLLPVSFLFIPLAIGDQALALFHIVSVS